MSARKTRLVDCNPRWGRPYDESGSTSTGWITFDCPEGHTNCWHTIPFTPDIEGAAWSRTGAIWQRDAATSTFENLTLSPSIRRVAAYASLEDAVVQGCNPDNIDAQLLCALHIFIKSGAIEFCGDSR